LGHQTCKNLYCVGADVKPCSINQSTNNLSLDEAIDLTRNRPFWKPLSMFGATHS